MGGGKDKEIRLSTFTKIARNFRHDANAIIDKRIHLRRIFYLFVRSFVPFPIHTEDYKIKTSVSKLCLFRVRIKLIALDECIIFCLFDFFQREFRIQNVNW